MQRDRRAKDLSETREAVLHHVRAVRANQGRPESLSGDLIRGQHPDHEPQEALASAAISQKEGRRTKKGGRNPLVHALLMKKTRAWAKEVALPRLHKKIKASRDHALLPERNLLPERMKKESYPRAANPDFQRGRAMSGAKGAEEHSENPIKKLISRGLYAKDRPLAEGKKQTLPHPRVIRSG